MRRPGVAVGHHKEEEKEEERGRDLDEGEGGIGIWMEQKVKMGLMVLEMVDVGGRDMGCRSSGRG